MIRFFLGTLVPLLLLVMQLWGTPVKPPTLTQANLTVTAKGGIRNPMREMPMGVIPVGEDRFFYYGTWDSNVTNNVLKFGTSPKTLQGYAGGRSKVKGMGIEKTTGASNAYFILANGKGDVIWAFSSDDGEFSGMVATVSEQNIYVAAEIKPVWRADHRNNDKVLASFATKGANKIVEDFDIAPEIKNFVAPEYIYILEIDLSGVIKRFFKPIEDAHPDITGGYYWFWPRRMVCEGSMLILDGKIPSERTIKKDKKMRYGIKYDATNPKVIEGEIKGKQILLSIDCTASTPRVTKVDYVKDQEKIKNYEIDAMHLTQDALYFAMTCSNGKTTPFTEDVAFLDKNIEVAGQVGGYYLVKTDKKLQKLLWVKHLPQGVNVQSIASLGDELYVSGAYGKTTTWGTTQLLNTLSGADNQAFWGTVSTTDGALGKAQFVQAGYSEGDGIAVTQERVYWQFMHIIRSDPNDYTGTQEMHREVLFGDGAQYATRDDLADEDELWVWQVGLACYDRTSTNLLAFTDAYISPSYMTIPSGTPTRVGAGGPVLSQNEKYLSSVVQSGAGIAPNVTGIKLFDEAFATPVADGYKNFCAFYGTLRLPLPKFTLTIKPSTEGVIKVQYYEGNTEVTKTVEQTDLQISLEKGQEFTMVVTPNATGKTYRFKYDSTKIGTTNSGATFKLLADATMEVIFLDAFTLAVEEDKVAGCYYKIYQNDNLLTSLTNAIVAKDDILKLEIVALGYTPSIVAEGATLVSGTTYKVNGDANVKFKISYTKDELQWRTITFTEALQPQGKLVVKVGGAEIKSGASVALGTRVECMLLQIPRGYKLTLNVTGLTEVSQQQQENRWSTIYFFNYEVTDNATVEVVLEKDETLWHTIAYTAAGTDAQGKPYTLKVKELGLEILTPVEPNGKLPKGAYFACDFTTEGGAFPTPTVTGAKKLTDNYWDIYGQFVYEVEDEVQISVPTWEVKLIPISINVKPKKLGSVKVTYEKEGVETEVNDGDQIPWGTICKIVLLPNPGVTLNKGVNPKLTGFAYVKEGVYKLEGPDEASIMVQFILETYSFSLVEHEGINISAELDRNGNKKPIVENTKLHYGDKVILTVTNNDEANQWLKSLKLTNLEKVEGEENTYSVTGNVVVEAEVVKLLPLTLKPSANAKYSVTYRAKGEDKSVAIEGTEVSVKADEKTVVTIKVTEVAAKHLLQGVRPLIAKPLATDPMSFTFDLTETMTVEVLTEALEYFDLTVACDENGKLLVTYTEQHAAQSGEKSEEVTGDKTLSIEKGTTVKLKAMPSEHYRVATFEVGKNAAFPQEGSFILSEATKVSVAFEKVSYAVAAISHRGKGTLTVTTLERQTNIELKQGDLVFESEKLQIAYKADPAFDAKPETLKVEGLKQEGDAYVVTGAVSVSIDFVPRTKPAAVDDALLAEVVVAPNPFDNQLRITSHELRGEYALLNAQGVVVASGVLENAETRINTSLLPAGMYLLRLSTESGATKTYRVVKQ